MSVREVLQLGIKGQDIILSALKKIQTEKLKFAKKATIPLGVGPGAPAPSQPAEPAEPKKSESTVAKDTWGAARETMQGLATLQTGAASKAALSGAAAAVGALSGGTLAPFATALAQAGSMLIDGAQNFVSQVKTAAALNADTANAYSRAQNLIASMDGKSGRDFLREGTGAQGDNRRLDISVSSQNAIIEGLGAKYGIVQNRLREAVERLFGTRDRPTDVAQVSQIAQGNFAALGTDEGFFKQQIANSISGLPPSARQEMMAQLMNSISTASLMKQGDIREREVSTAFNMQDRGQAAVMAQNAGTALAVQQKLYAGNEALVGGMGALVDKLGSLTGDIQKLSGGVIDLKNTIQNKANDARDSINRVLDGVKAHP